jgi:hypothetical protein
VENIKENTIKLTALKYLSSKYKSEDFEQIKIECNNINIDNNLIIRSFYVFAYLLFLVVFVFIYINIFATFFNSRKFQHFSFVLFLISIIFGPAIVWQRSLEIHPAIQILLNYSLLFRIFLYISIFIIASTIIVFEFLGRGWILDFLMFDLSDFKRGFEEYLPILLIPLSIFYLALIVLKQIKRDIF